jgi:hypothetical protein
MLDSCFTAEEGCYTGPRIAKVGTIMSYCHLMSKGIDFSLGFGPKPGALIRNNYLNSSCLAGTEVLPILTVNPSDTACTGSAFPLKVTEVPGATYSWQGPNGFISSLRNPVLSSIGPLQQGEYTVKVTKGECSSAQLKTRLTVNCISTTPLARREFCGSSSSQVYFVSENLPSSGNVYSVQLSDRFGSFANPVIIGTLPSLQKSGSIPVQIPAGLIPDSGYTLRVNASSPAFTGQPMPGKLVIKPKPLAPLTADIEKCSPSAFTFLAQGNGEIRWFSAANALVPLQTGPTFITPFLSSTTSFWVENQVKQKLTLGDLMGPAPDTTLAFNTYHGMYIRVKKNLILDSLTVYSSGSGTLAFNLKDSSNTFTYRKIQVPITGNTFGQKVKIGLEISPGIYRMDAEGSELAGLYRLNNFLGFPIASLAMDIIGSSVPGRYYFFHDLRITALDCPSERKEVKAIIQSVTLPTGSDSSRCGPGQVQLKAFGALTGEIFKWYINATGSDTLSGGENGTLLTPSLTQTQTYFVTKKKGLCESTPRIPFRAHIGSMPLSPVLTFSTWLTAVPVDTTYEWYKDGILIATAGDSLNPALFGSGIYSVILKRLNGCFSQSGPVNVVVSNKEAISSTRNFLAFPNPSTGSFVLKGSDWQGSCFHIFDLQGKSIESRVLSSGRETIDLRMVANGVYLVRIESASSVQYLRLWKN